MDLPKAYDPKSVEPKWAEKWAKNPFVANPKSGKPPFVIFMPPPNVTGSLHMGHALDNSLQDALIRYKRMRGFEAVWLPGTDHAGIATQVVVERLLLKEGKTRHDLGREKFLERVWQWKEEHGEKCSRPGPTHGDLTTLVPHLERPQDPVLHLPTSSPGDANS